MVAGNRQSPMTRSLKVNGGQEFERIRLRNDYEHQRPLPRIERRIEEIHQFGQVPAGPNRLGSHDEA